MQRMVCLTPRAAELSKVGGTVVFVVGGSLGAGVTETTGAEVVVEALRLASIVLCSLEPVVDGSVAEDRLVLSVAELISEETLGLPVTVFAETPGLVKKPEPVIVMDAVMVSVTVTAGHVLSVPCAFVTAAPKERMRAATRSERFDLNIIFARHNEWLT